MQKVMGERFTCCLSETIIGDFLEKTWKKCHPLELRRKPVGRQEKTRAIK